LIPAWHSRPATIRDDYAAFALDPDGNNIEVVYHGPATYSADSAKVTF
jgi:hypothetical protein